MSEIQKVLQLPTATNLSQLSEEQLISFVNDKFEGVVDALIQAAYRVKECGDGLRELQLRYGGVGGRNQKGGFSDFFNTCLQQRQVKLNMGRAQAYRYIAVSQRWQEIEPRLLTLKSKVMKEGRVSPISLLRLLDEAMEEAEEPAIEVQVKETIIEKEVEKIVTKEVKEKNTVPKAKLLETQNKLKEQEEIVLKLQQQLEEIESQQEQMDIDEITPPVVIVDGQEEIERLKAQLAKIQLQERSIKDSTKLSQNEQHMIKQAQKFQQEDQERIAAMGETDFAVVEAFKGCSVRFLYAVSRPELKGHLKEAAQEIYDILTKYSV